MGRKTFTLNITAEIIAKSVRKNSHRCMIANAIHDQIAGASGIDVTWEGVRFNKGDTRYYFPTPPKAAVALLKFDHKKPVKPFKAKLDWGFSAPVVHRPKKHERIGPPRKKYPSDYPDHPLAKRTSRRRSGLKVIEVRGNG